MPLNQQSIRRHGAAVGLLLGMSTGLCVPAIAQTPVPIVYTTDPGSVANPTRQLIFSNNPEQIYAPYTDTTTAPGTTTYYYDLADNGLGAQSLLQITVPEGQYRDYFEHVNKTGQSLSYAVQVYNPGNTTLVVTLGRKGFTPDAASGNSTGASAIADLMNSTTAPMTYRVLPGRSVWVLRTDTDYAGTKPNANGKYAAGVVDFDVAGGSALVSNIAYQNARALSRWNYMGFITRAYPSGQGTPESRVYKGLFQYPGQTAPTGAGVTAPIMAVIDDSTTAGELPVTYKRYTYNGSQYVPSTNSVPAGTTAWWTNDTPARDKTSASAPIAYMVGSDVFDINLPLAPSGSLLVEALKLRSWPNSTATQANIGNYGVQYHESVRVTNNGTRARRVSLTLNNYGSGSSSYAYPDWSKNDGTWTWDYSRTTLTTNAGVTTATYNQTVTYAQFDVPADGQEHTYEAYYILGAPSGGQLRHAIKVGEVTP